MSSKRIAKAISAPAEIWEMASEMGGGNASKGFRDAVKMSFEQWKEEQKRKWSDKSEGEK